jgi:hypothetical protein
VKKLLLLLLSLVALQQAVGQIHLLPKFVQRMYFNKDTSRRNSFVILPVLSSAPETGIEAGAAGLLSFYSDTIHHNTKISNIFGYATVTTKSQNRLSLSTSYWAPQNIYHYAGAISFINFPFDFYGIGNNTRKANIDYVAEKRYKLNIEGDFSLGSSIYAGFVAGGFKYAYHDNSTTGIFYTDPQIQGRSGGSGVFIGPSLNYDSRDNNTYTTKGMLIASYFDIIQGIFGNNNYTGGLFNIEYAQFFAISKQLVLGVDIQEQSLTGGGSPFYLLPQMGSDEMMRGYYQGRYRDRNLINGQMELRYRFVPSVAIVGFIGTGEVFNSAFSISQLKPDYGGGIRYFFDVVKGLSVRVDYGIGEKPAGESRETGLYIGLGQAF